MGAEKLNESLVKYLAGLLDADGSLSFSFKSDPNNNGRNWVGLTLSLCASDAIDKDGFVDQLSTLTGMGTNHRDGKSKQNAVWRVSKRADLEMLLPRLIKHMVIKGAHWHWLLNEWRRLRVDNTTISEVEMVALKQASKESRANRSGPLKPKNHPTWAWLAGYLDGDGWYSRRQYRNGENPYRQWKIQVGAVAHVNDSHVLHFLQKSFGGVVRPQGQADNVLVWVRSLGYQNRSFALSFLPNLTKHSRLKRYKIDAILHHHRQRLSVPGTPRNFCSADKCQRPAHGHGLCSMHYLREYRERVSDSLSPQ